MLAQPSMIKRPVLDLGGGKLLVGFAPDEFGECRPGYGVAHLAARFRAR